jgi:hypothetical protein
VIRNSDGSSILLGSGTELFLGNKAIGVRDGLIVKVVPLRFRQQENVLMSLRATVCHGFWHRVRFVPDDVLT